MSNNRKFYINGEWVEPNGSDTVDVINPQLRMLSAQLLWERTKTLMQLLQQHRMHLKLSPKQQLKNGLNS